MSHTALPRLLAWAAALSLAAGCARVPSAKPADDPWTVTVRSAPEQTTESAAAAKPDLTGLEEELRQLINEQPEDPAVSVYYLDLDSGASLSLYPDPYYPCSMIKIVCLAAVYDAVEAGDMDESEAQPLLEHMITISDNTAFNLLAQEAGKDRMKQVLEEAGATDTTISHGLLPGDAYFEADPGEPDNTSTARDMALVLDYICRYPDEDLRESMLSLLEACEDDKALAQGLPEDVPFAHKTGWADAYYHDGGIVFADERPYILVVMTEGADMDLFGQISQTVYDFQTGLTEAALAQDPFS